MRSNRGILSAAACPLLLPFSLVYSAVSGIHRRSSRRLRLPRPVISVGNITWGGTGKTPVTIALANAAIKSGLKTVILSRGYRGKNGSRHPLAVSDGTSLLAPVREAGDEPALMAESVPGCAVVVCGDRYAAGMAAMERFDPDLFILDDGFQHWKLERDLNVVCVNAIDPFGNGHLIPAGKLREPLKALSRADMIIITNADAGTGDELVLLEDEIRKFAPGTPVVRSVCAVKGFRLPAFAKAFPPDYLNGKEAAAFSGLGDDRGFRRTMLASGIEPAGYVAFRDHYWYNKKDIVSVMKRFPYPCPVITTAKDAVRLKDLIANIDKKDAARLFVLDTEIQIMNGGSPWEYAVRKMQRSSSTATAR